MGYPDNWNESAHQARWGSDETDYKLPSEDAINTACKEQAAVHAAAFLASMSKLGATRLPSFKDVAELLAETYSDQMFDAVQASNSEREAA